MNEEQNALKELKEFLGKGEVIEGIVFGDWGSILTEPNPPPVPRYKRGKVLSLKVAGALMKGWTFNGDYGSVSCYATYVWTNKRVIWVTQYDGATWLSSVPRNPTPTFPDMPGG